MLTAIRGDILDLCHMEAVPIDRQSWLRFATGSKGV